MHRNTKFKLEQSYVSMQLGILAVASTILVFRAQGIIMGIELRKVLLQQSLRK